MAIIDLPAKFSFTGVPSFKMQRKGAKLQSKYTGQSQLIVFPFAVWFLEGQLLAYDGLDAGRVRSFLMQLEGQKNTFRLPIPGYSTALTGYTANRLVTVAAASRARSITVGGGAPGTDYLAEGDYITIQDEAKMVTSPVAFDGGGNATISFGPGIRQPVAIGVPVICHSPTVLMRALDDDIADLNITPPVRQGVNNFQVVEAIEIA